MSRKLICAVPNCINKDGNPEVRYFCFPRTTLQLEKWISVIQNKALNTNISRTSIYRVCERHFREDQFQNAARLKLNRNVYPTLNLVEREDMLADPAVEQMDVEEFPEAIEGPSTSKTYSQMNPKTLLASIGATSARSLSPRKRILYNSCRVNARKLRENQRRFKKRLAVQKQKKYIEDFGRLSASARIFINSQLRQKSRMKKVHWTDEEKALCLAMLKSSPKGYRFLRKIFSLPTERTLRRFLGLTAINPGINEQVVKYLATVSENLPAMQRYCIIMFDEVFLSPNLSFNRGDKSVSGLQDFGEFKEPFVADHALVFMLRGINQKWKQPISFYFVRSGTKTFQLKKLILENIQTIHEKTKFRILASVSDQGTANVASIASLADDSGFENQFVYTAGGIKIFHIFDAPHLVKCFRNNFLNKRVLFDGQLADWSHIVQLFELDDQDPEGKICPKLTSQHIAPEGRAKMRVKLATQVFSRSVYAGLKFLNNNQKLDCEGTANLVIFMDRLFDSLNSSYSSAKPLNRPVTKQSDHSNFWLNAKKTLSSITFIKDNGSATTSPPCIKNLIASIRNIQSLFRYMQELGYKFLLTRTLNQDPLENFFAVIRSLCGDNNSPTTVQFVAAYKTALINNIMSISRNTNCEDDGTKLLLSLLDSRSKFLRSAIPNSFNVNNTNVDSMDVDDCEPSTSFANSVPVEIIHLPFSISHNDDLKLCESLSQIKISQQTNGYIAGFIYKKFLKRDCLSCNKFFLGPKTSESHALIILKEYNSDSSSLHYPSLNFINMIKQLREMAFFLIIENINSSDIVQTVINNIMWLGLQACGEHDRGNESIILRSATYITIKYILTTLNRKMHQKDARSNSELDGFLKKYGPTRFKK